VKAHSPGAARFPLNALIYGSMETLVSEDGKDFVQPRMDAKGNLYFIKRPYDDPRLRKRSPITVAKDVLLFPYRLGVAIVHFLNAFSMMFSKKPLITAGGPKREEDMRKMILWGQLVEANENAPAGEDHSWIPKSWQLMRRKPDGSDSVIASGVAAYDLSADGNPVWTNATTIRDGSGVIGKGALIESVVVF
jgi:hypothetical protein